MAITRWDPFRDMFVLQNRVNSLFHDFNRGQNDSDPVSTAAFVPAVDIYEDEHKIVLKLEVPGMKQDDLDIQHSGEQSLTQVVEEELTSIVVGRTGITWFLGTLAGRFKGADFTARVRYTRTWVHADEQGWRLLAAHVSNA